MNTTHIQGIRCYATCTYACQAFRGRRNGASALIEEVSFVIASRIACIIDMFQASDANRDGRCQSMSGAVMASKRHVGPLT
jgi:hypothetical protein